VGIITSKPDEEQDFKFPRPPTWEEKERDKTAAAATSKAQVDTGFASGDSFRHSQQQQRDSPGTLGSQGSLHSSASSLDTYSDIGVGTGSGSSRAGNNKPYSNSGSAGIADTSNRVSSVPAATTMRRNTSNSSTGAASSGLGSGNNTPGSARASGTGNSTPVGDDFFATFGM
jgi:hypothetical protein